MTDIWAPELLAAKLRDNPDLAVDEPFRPVSIRGTQTPSPRKPAGGGKIPADALGRARAFVESALMSEEELQDSVIELATTLGWLVHAERRARTANGWRTPVQGFKGFPDLVLAREHVTLFAELKSEVGKLTPEQLVWAEALGTTVWRPRDWMSGRIEEVLK